NLACIPVLLEIIERHDDHTVGNAEDAIRKLTNDLEQYTDEVKSAVTRCQNRARASLTTYEGAFAPIRDKAVPERIVMQATMDGFRSLLQTTESTLRDWPSERGVAEVASSAPAPAPRTGGGVPKGLMAIPIVIAVLGFVGWKKMSAPAPTPAPAVTAAAEAPAPTQTAETPHPAAEAAHPAALGHPAAPENRGKREGFAVGTMREVATGRLHVLDWEHVVGRGGPPACSLTLDDHLVSGIHAAVRWTGSAWEVKDLGSRNGTFVDGRRLDVGASAPLRDRSRVAFGRLDREWELVDARTPRVMVVPIPAGEPLFFEQSSLSLPSNDDARASVYLDTEGTWTLERSGGLPSA